MIIMTIKRTTLASTYRRCVFTKMDQKTFSLIYFIKRKFFKALSFLMYSNKNKPSTFIKAKNETKIQLPKWVKSWVLKPQRGSLDQVQAWTRWGKNLNPGFFQSHWSQHWLVIGAKQRVPLHSACYILSQSWKFSTFWFPLRNETGKKFIFPAYRAQLPISDHWSFSCCSQFLAVNRSSQTVNG